MSTHITPNLDLFTNPDLLAKPTFTFLYWVSVVRDVINRKISAADRAFKGMAVNVGVYLGSLID